MDKIAKLLAEVERDLELIDAIQTAREKCLKQLRRVTEFENKLLATPVSEREKLKETYLELVDGVLLN